MTRGKQTCKILKEIRRHIAEANGIELVTTECRYRGDCLGTCPKCEAEVRYLEQQLRQRQLAGKIVNIAGVSVGAIALLAPTAVQSQSPNRVTPVIDSAIHASAEVINIKGTVVAYDTLPSGELDPETLIYATVENLNSGCKAFTNADGEYEIEACIGDSLMARYVGTDSVSAVVTDAGRLDFVLSYTPSEPVICGAYVREYNPKHDLYFEIRGEDGEILRDYEVKAERIYKGEDGEEVADDLYIVSNDDDRGLLLIRWDWYISDKDGNILKDATIRFTADDYDKPIFLKVKRPSRRKVRKIVFTH